MQSKFIFGSDKEEPDSSDLHAVADEGLWSREPEVPAEIELSSEQRNPSEQQPSGYKQRLLAAHHLRSPSRAELRAAVANRQPHEIWERP